MAKTATAHHKIFVMDPEAPMIEHRIGSSLRWTYKVSAQALSEVLEPYRVTVGMWYFFRVLWDHNGLSQRELSQRVGARDSTTMEAISRMETAGFIRRSRSSEDRRKIVVNLTPRGKSLRSKLLPLVLNLNRAAIAGLTSAEVSTLDRILETIRTNLQRHSGLTRRT